MKGGEGRWYSEIRHTNNRSLKEKNEQSRNADQSYDKRNLSCSSRSPEFGYQEGLPYAQAKSMKGSLYSVVLL